MTTFVFVTSLDGTPGSIATLSPTCNEVTPIPIAETIPEDSYPNTIGKFKTNVNKHRRIIKNAGQKSVTSQH